MNNFIIETKNVSLIVETEKIGNNLFVEKRCLHVMDVCKYDKEIRLLYIAGKWYKDIDYVNVSFYMEQKNIKNLFFADRCLFILKSAKKCCFKKDVTSYIYYGKKFDIVFRAKDFNDFYSKDMIEKGTKFFEVDCDMTSPLFQKYKDRSVYGKEGNLMVKNRF